MANNKLQLVETALEALTSLLENERDLGLTAEDVSCINTVGERLTQLVEDWTEDERQDYPKTRNGRLQAMADHGIDTWQDYRGEK